MGVQGIIGLMKTRILQALNIWSSWLVPVAAIGMVVFWLYISPPGILGAADSLGYAVCHRLSSHSLHFLDGTQLPLCARCSGMYLGAVLGLAFQGITARKRGGNPPWKIILPLAALFLAFGFDGVNSYVGLMKSISPGRLDFIPNFYTTTNTIRLLTGTGMGIVIAVALYPSFNQTMLQDWDPTPAIGDYRSLGLLLAAGLILDLLVLTNLDIVLYPAALISAGGVLLLLTTIYAMLWTMLTKHENQFLRIGAMWLPILAGLTVALVQITGTDLFRLWLTHTWGGFPLPGVG